MRSYTVVLSMLFMCICFSATAQRQLRYTEIGGFIGTLNYSGEIATTTNPSSILKEMRPQLGFYLRRNYSALYSIGLEASAGWIHAEDANHTNTGRNWTLNTPMVMVNTVGELNFRKFGKFYKKNSWTFFIRGGLGVSAYYPDVEGITFNPEYMEMSSGSFVAMNFFAGGGIKFRVGHASILSIYADAHGLMGDNLEGFTYKDRAFANDYYGGIRVAYSHCIF
ncbi:MAG: hypothetical protein SchgKO_09520 [Schleiferiaceae bacterium]